MTPLDDIKLRIDKALDAILAPSPGRPSTLLQAMRYSALAPGKRTRPALVLLAAEAVAGKLGFSLPSTDPVPAACAIEMVHVYSLVHDDLPCMDDDDMRRGRPTSHKVYGEAMAILAGDALFTLAMQTLAIIEGAPAENVVRLINELSFASGTIDGMIGGQVSDIEGERQTPTAELLETIHRAKTGALLKASVRMGAIAAGATESQLAALSSYGEHIGLAFQIVDDILDVEESSEALGKTAGKDEKAQKATYPRIVGLEKSRKIAADLTRKAFAALKPFKGRAKALEALAQYLLERQH